MAGGERGATSSGDVLDLAQKFAYGKNQAFGQLGAQTEAGKNAAMAQYFNANAAAGDEYAKKNQYDREQYQQGLNRAGALEQAGATNTYGALDQLGGAAGKYLLNEASTDPATATANQNKKIQSIYNKYFQKQVNTNVNNEANNFSNNIYSNNAFSF